MNMFIKGGNIMKKSISNLVVWCLILLTAAPVWAVSSEPNTSPVFKQEELDQLLAPIALYPDSLLSQILMASTYPLEVVQAQRWMEQNKALDGNDLAAALEKETWDPSVKSLVNFPQVLAMMSEKLDWTQKLGDAFLAQQKDVMDTAQKLRGKAQEQGTLKTTEQQIVKIEPNVIIIESADPQVVYVPTYDPNVVYGHWSYPDYPPYYYYPPGYIYGSDDIYYGPGFGLGAAWGWAWGHSDWHRGDIDIDIGRNLNINPLIDRGKYAQQYQNRGQFNSQSGRGTWQHNPANRKGVAYRDQATAQKFNRASTPDAVKSREAFRGRAEQGRQELTGSRVDQGRQNLGVGGAGVADRSNVRPNTVQRGQPATRDTPGTRDISNRDLSNRSRPSQGQSMNRGSAFQGMDRGNAARNYSSRGQTSRQSMSRPSGSRGGGGGSRGGGGGGRR
jgi:hypothetical protein